MADFIIKSAAGTGNKTIIQGQDQSGSNYAIQVGDAGASTLHNATITAGTFPTGVVVQVKSISDGTAFTNSTQDWEDVISISIDNVQSGSKIHIHAAISTISDSAGEVAFRVIDSVGGVLCQNQQTHNGNTSWSGGLNSMMGEDTSPLVGTNTYKIQMHAGGTITGYYNYRHATHEGNKSFYQILEVR